MNKVILMGRLTRDPEVRYSQSAAPVAVARYSLAVRKQYVKQGEQEVDFINIVAFGKAAEFTEKFFRKGQQVAVVGRLSTRVWEKQDGTKQTVTEVIVEEQHFAESKKDAGESHPQEDAFQQPSSGMEESDDLPF